MKRSAGTKASVRGSVPIALALCAAGSGSAGAATADAYERVALEGAGETLSCLRGGSGSPMLLLHGWPQTADEWLPVMPALTASHTVYACDLPGIRASTNADDDFTKADMAADIHAALSSEVSGPVHVVGHDIGLMVAFAYGHAFPEDVASLTLMDAPLPGSDVYDAILASPMAWHFAFHQVEEVPERIVGNDVDYYLRHFITELWRAEGGPPPAAIDPFVAAYSDPDTLRAGFELYRAFGRDAEDNAALFETPLEMPVLALSSGELAPAPYVLEMMRPLASDLRGGSVAGAGHWLTEEAPDAVSAAILGLTAEVDR